MCLRERGMHLIRNREKQRWRSPVPHKKGWPWEPPASMNILPLTLFKKSCAVTFRFSIDNTPPALTYLTLLCHWLSHIVPRHPYKTKAARAIVVNPTVRTTNLRPKKLKLALGRRVNKRSSQDLNSEHADSRAWIL